MSVLDRPLVFVDIETNGLNHIRGRVIEVAAIRVENGKIVREFSQLVDPGSELPWYITNLTGITTNDVRQAPTFEQIAEELYDLLEGAIFVAHNVRFDYSFLKQEFKRIGKPFLPQQICTVKMSKALFPQERSHKLESIIRRHGLSFEHRHRAYDDAAVLWQFLQLAQEQFGVEIVEQTLAKQLPRPALPKHVPEQIIRDLPDGPGVYIFYDEAGRPLYVGKSISIKKRVLSHFGQDHAEAKEFKISQSIHHIEARETAGELAALLLESELVKSMQPVFNRQLRRLSKLTLAKQSSNDLGYTTIELHEATAIDPSATEDILAVYPRRSQAKSSLEEITKLYQLCPKLCGLEKAKGACFWRQLGKCRGACAGMETPDAYNERLRFAFERRNIAAWPYDGAIVVEDKKAAAADDHRSGIVIDQWCIIATVDQDPYCEPVVTTRKKVFDLDTYKILQSYFAQKMTQLTIRPFGYSNADNSGA